MRDVVPNRIRSLTRPKDPLHPAQAFIRANVLAAGVFELVLLGLSVWLAAFPTLDAESVLPICTSHPSFVVPQSYDLIAPDLLPREEFRLAQNDGR